MKEQEWFETWFDSPYYHMLYKHRDEDEAAQFISKLVHYLKPDKQDLFLDLACGKGRHSIYLNSLGYRVDGLDYSENSIETAKQSENDTLHFYRHDMRLPLPKKDYSFILNLFTSFGYFETDEEHRLCLYEVAQGLKPQGIFIIDFMNSKNVLKGLVEHEELKRGGITFNIDKTYKDGRIIKRISFKDKDHVQQFKEEVRAFTRSELESLLTGVGFQIIDIFGDYELQPFSEDLSERMIIVAQV